MFLSLQLPTHVANFEKPAAVRLITDVGTADASLLISKKPLVSKKGEIDFAMALLEIEHGVIIKLINFPRGHIALPARPPSALQSADGQTGHCA